MTVNLTSSSGTKLAIRISLYGTPRAAKEHPLRGRSDLRRLRSHRSRCGREYSETGVLVRSPIMEPLGTVVGLVFREFKAKGEIIWTREIDEGALLGMRIVSMGWRGWQVISGSQGPSGEQS